MRSAVSDPDREEVSVMTRKVLLALAVIGIGAGAVAAYNRSDCPGVKTCPLTGQPVCVDQCPVSK
jgi:hypothetical protein